MELQITAAKNKLHNAHTALNMPHRTLP